MKHKPDESPPLAFPADVDITSFLVVELLKGENLVKNGEMRGGKKERRKRKEVGKGFRGREEEERGCR